MQIASEVCVFTNDRLTIETIEGLHDLARLRLSAMLIDRRTFAVEQRCIASGCATVGAPRTRGAARRSRR